MKDPMFIANGNVRLEVQPGELTITDTLVGYSVQIDSGDFEALAVALVKLGVLQSYTLPGKKIVGLDANGAPVLGGQYRQEPVTGYTNVYTDGYTR